MTLRHLRSDVAGKRPLAGDLVDGQLAVGYHATTPGVFLKDTAGAIVKVGPMHVGTTAPNGGNGSLGESWLDTSQANPVLKVWNGSAFVIPQPLASGTLITTTSSGVITGAMVASNTLTNANISAGAAIADSKLATITTAGKVANSATTATSADTAGSIVARDGSGNFSAGVITAALAGNATTASTLAAARLINGVAFNGSSDVTITATTPSTLTFNNSGVGAASGSGFSGGSALTVSYNTVGAPSVAGANATGTWGISVTGNAGTATRLQTTRTINGVAFDGTANISIPSSIPNEVLFNSSGTGAAAGSAFNGELPLTVSYNTVGAASATGANASGLWDISVLGNAATATALEVSRTINGVAFNGSQSITVTATTDAALTFNNSGTGSASGLTFNGGLAGTVSYNTIGAAAAGGSNATGTWGIAITGNAGTATRLSSTRTFTLSGDVTGTATSDLSSGFSVSTSIGSGVITNFHISNSAGIGDGKLAQITTAGKVANSATTATSASTANAIVARDGSGNFSAGTITATLNGNAVTANAWATGRTITLTGDVTGVSGSWTGSGNISFATSITAGSIVNTSISNSAAIAGTKISPNFGSQDVVTTGTVTAAHLIPSISATVPLVGLYRTTGSILSIATQGVEQLRVGASNITFYNVGNVRGSSTAYANYTLATIQSDVTSAAYGSRIQLSTASAGTTHQNVIYHLATQGTYNGAVTTQVGFDVDGGFTGATNNYGFRGSIPSGTGRWNIYADGTASNYFAGNVGIGTTAPEAPLHVNGDAIVGSINSGPLAGLRNAFINANFDVWQRGVSFSNPANNSYTADRWVYNVNGTGATRTISRQAFTLGQTSVPGNPTYWLRCAQTVAGSGGTVSDIAQRIEGVKTFAGQEVTLSFYAKSVTSNITLPNVFYRQNFGTGGSPSTQVNGTIAANIAVTTSWQKFTYRFTLPSISGKTLGTDGNDFLSIDIRYPLNATFTCDLAQVQLELGPVATPFEARPIGVEQVLCQRYYEADGGSALVFNAGWNSAQFKVTKRASPTVSVSITSGTLSGLVSGVNGFYATNTTVSSASFTASAEL